MSTAEYALEASIDERQVFEELVETEVKNWYRVFYAWSRGTVPDDIKEILSISNALAKDFRVLLTNGQLMKRETYIERLAGLYGTRANSKQSHICNYEIEILADGIALVTFDLFKEGVKAKKFDTAIIRRAPEAEGGVTWVYVHESEHDLDEPATIENLL